MVNIVHDLTAGASPQSPHQSGHGRQLGPRREAGLRDLRPRKQNPDANAAPIPHVSPTAGLRQSLLRAMNVAKSATARTPSRIQGLGHTPGGLCEGYVLRS